MLGCAAVVTVPAVVAAPVNAPTNVVEVTLDSPVTVVVVVPSARVVLPNITFEFASLACASVPLAILDAFIPVIDDPLPEKELALTKLTQEICDPAPDIVICAFATKVNPVNEVLTDVIFGWAAVVTVPAVVALVAAPLSAPTNVVAVIELFDKLAVRPVLVSSAIFPVAAFAKMRKLFPVPAATLMKSARFA
jgi:hypothetical protein